MTSGTLEQLDNINYYLAARIHLGSSMSFWRQCKQLINIMPSLISVRTLSATIVVRILVSLVICLLLVGCSYIQIQCHIDCAS